MQVTKAMLEKASLAAIKAPLLPPVKSTKELLERMRAAGIEIVNDPERPKQAAEKSPDDLENDRPSTLDELRAKGWEIGNDDDDSGGIAIIGAGPPPSEPIVPTPTENGPKPKRTPEEQSFIDVVARSHGREWAETHAELILNQARSIGDL